MMYVKPKKWDLLHSKETLRLAHAFFSGREIIDLYKRRDPNRKVVSVTFPFSELVLACDATPLFLMRYEKFGHQGIDKVLRALTRVSKMAGWDTIDGAVKLAHLTSAGTSFIEEIVEKLIEALLERYAALTKKGENAGFPMDSCFATRFLYGLSLNSGSIADAAMNVSYRCGFFYKYFEALDDIIPNNYTIDVPLTQGRSAMSALDADLAGFIEMMDGLTGSRFTEDKLAEILDVSNELKALYKEFIYTICTGETIPYVPLTFSEIQALLMYSFIDFNSNIKAYRKNFRAMMDEMLVKMQKGNGFDAKGRPYILYAPMFGGLEQENVKAVSDLGGVVHFADWEIFGFLEPVNTRNNVLSNFARHMLRVNEFMGTCNDVLAGAMTRVATDMRVDGILFQGVFACRNINPVTKLFKQHARMEGIPVVETSFNNIGENVEQNKTRIEAFMEMIGTDIEDHEDPEERRRKLQKLHDLLSL